MNERANEPGPRAEQPGPWPLTVQVLFGLKSADPTALTAAEAMRHLLGLGDTLVGLDRRILHEIVLTASEGTVREGKEEGPSPLLSDLSRALDREPSLWNPNKQRGWIRLEAVAPGGNARDLRAFELLPGGRSRAAEFGRPSLADPGSDHLLLWKRGQRAAEQGLAGALPGWRLLAWGYGELYTFRWREGATREEREGWTASVAVARSRTQGLLVNPHYQDHRIFPGAVPLPLWGG